jgi:hypothetical protein
MLPKSSLGASRSCLGWRRRLQTPVLSELFHVHLNRVEVGKTRSDRERLEFRMKKSRNGRCAPEIQAKTISCVPVSLKNRVSSDEFLDAQLRFCDSHFDRIHRGGRLRGGCLPCALGDETQQVRAICLVDRSNGYSLSFEVTGLNANNPVSSIGKIILDFSSLWRPVLVSPRNPNPPSAN